MLNNKEKIEYKKLWMNSDSLARLTYPSTVAHVSAQLSIWAIRCFSDVTQQLPDSYFQFSLLLVVIILS